VKAEYVQPKEFLDMHGHISVFLNGYLPLERKYLTLLLLMMTGKQDIRDIDVKNDLDAKFTDQLHKEYMLRVSLLQQVEGLKDLSALMRPKSKTQLREKAVEIISLRQIWGDNFCKDGKKRQQNIVDQLGNTHMRILAARSDDLSIDDNTMYTTKIPWTKPNPSSGTEGFNNDIQITESSMTSSSTLFSPELSTANTNISPEQSQEIIVAEPIEKRQKRHLLSKEVEVLLSCISRNSGPRLVWDTIASDYMKTIDTNVYPELQTGERLRIVYKNIKAQMKKRSEEDTANVSNPLISAELVIIDPQTVNNVMPLSTITTVNIPLNEPSLRINEINEAGYVAREGVITDVTVDVPLKPDNIAFDNEEVNWLHEYAHSMVGRDIVAKYLKAAHLRQFKTFMRNEDKLKKNIKEYKRSQTYKTYKNKKK